MYLKSGILMSLAVMTWDVEEEGAEFSHACGLAKVTRINEIAVWAVFVSHILLY
jgi:hypothetical protein